MIAQNTAEPLSPTSALLAARFPRDQFAGKKNNAEAASGFDLLLNSAPSAPDTNTSSRTSASCRNRNIDSKACETSSKADPDRSASQTDERSDTISAQPKTDDIGQIPPREPEGDGSEADTHDEAVPATETASLTDEISVLLQAGMQISQSSANLSETQNSCDCVAVLPSKQDAVNNAVALQDAKALPSPEELSAALSQIEDVPGEKTVSLAPSTTTLEPNARERTPTDSKIHQPSDARTEGALNNFISSIKESSPFKTLSDEQFSLSIGSGDKQDVSPSLPGNATMQEKADFTGMTNREAALVHQMTPSAKTPSSEIHSENMLRTTRSIHAPDPNDGKAQMIASGNRLAVALEPEGLGKLNINLSLDRGTINAQIQVSDPASRTLLENNMQQILDTLMNEGLTVGGFSVSLKHDEAGNGAGEQEVKGFLKSAEQILTDTEESRSFDHSSRVNIFV